MKTILVTGANRGLGLETCKQLAQLGHKVILTSRNDAQAVAESIGCDYHELDVTNEESIQSLKKFVKETYGTIDVLINNAGICLNEDTPLLEINLSDLREMLEVNTIAVFRLSQVLYPLVNESIVNVSSRLAQLTQMNDIYAAYRVSKTAVNAVTRIFAALGKVRVNCVSPGWVRTDMGGPQAPLSVEEGVETIIWAALEAQGNGKFYQDKQEIAW